MEDVGAESARLTDKQRKSIESFLTLTADLFPPEESEFWKEWVKGKTLGQRTKPPHPDIPEWNPDPFEIPEWKSTLTGWY